MLAIHSMKKQHHVSVPSIYFFKFVHFDDNFFFPHNQATQGTEVFAELVSRLRFRRLVFADFLFLSQK